MRRPQLSPAAITLVLLTAAGCSSSVGPVEMRIETGGVRYDDFVIEPIQEYGRLHSSKMVPMDPLVVSTEQTVTLPRFRAERFFVTLLVSGYHPEFVYDWTGDSDSAKPGITLSPLRPQRWRDYLEERGEVTLATVKNHLDQILGSFVPAFEPGEPRSRLCRYLPGLADLVERAVWSRGDARWWPDEARGRAELQDTLSSISDLMHCPAEGPIAD